MKPWLVALLILLSLQGFASRPCLAEDRQVAGRYKVEGRTIRHTITIPEQPPGAVIVIQYLPPGTGIIAAEPAYSSYDQANGEAKWLLKNVSPGPLHITLELDHEVARDTIRAETLFKDSPKESGYTKPPQSVIRKRKVEGC
ncbi:MAG: hypothetical protein ACOY3Z_11705 [Thermodesulfobacteriota bacterium]